MIVPDDIAAWFYTQVNVAAVTGSVSGGFWNGRPLETASSPYGVFLVSRESPPEYTSAGELPKFRVNLGVYTQQAATTQAQGVEIAVGRAVPVVCTGATAMIRGGAATVIHAEPRECSADVAFPMRAKDDIVAARMSWEVWVQAATTGA